MGCSRYLKEQNPAVQIIGLQPCDGDNIPGIRRWPAEYMPSIYEPERVDRVLDISQAEARETTRQLAAKEGIFCGISAGCGGRCVACGQGKSWRNRRHYLRSR